jgi:hypothetical protein
MDSRIEESITKADKALGLLPLNEHKTLASALLKIVFPVLAVKFPVLLFAAPIIDALTSIGIGVGLLHKTVKAAKKKE